MRVLAICLGSVGLLASAGPASGEDCTAPCAGYEITLELQNDGIFAADPAFLRSTIVEPTITADVFVAPVEQLKLFASILTETVEDPPSGQSAAFEGIGTFVGELYAALDVGPVAARAGKFDTVFSLASETLPGINADEIASAFDADERLGAEVVAEFDAIGLNHAIAGVAFTTDRTALSGSLFTRRPRARLSDGGAGNTEDLSSVALTLSGCRGAAPAECYEEGAFGYRLGYRHQEAGWATDEQIEDGIGRRDENAFLAAATWALEREAAKLRFLGEFAYLRNFEGGRDDALILTGSAALDRGQMRYVATYSHQRKLVAGEPDSRARLVDLETIYRAAEDRPIDGSRWGLGAAYTFLDDDGEATHRFTLRAVLELEGGVGRDDDDDP